MNRLLDDSLVALVLLLGFGYAIYSLGPKSLRVTLMTAAAALLGRVPPASRALRGRTPGGGHGAERLRRLRRLWLERRRPR